MPDVDMVGPTAGLTGEDIAPNAVVPGLYFSMPINEKMNFGLGFYSDFGFTLQYDNSFQGLAAADLSEVKTVYMSGSLGYKLNDHWSLGAGISAVKADAECPELLLM